MKISAVKNLNYTNISPYKPVKNTAEVNYENSYNSIPAGKISYIYFTGVNSTKPTKFLKQTLDLVDEIYDNYEKSLMEVPLEEISQTAEELTEETGKSKKEVLNAMSSVTQWSGISSLNKIGDVLKKNHIGTIGDWKHNIETFPYTEAFEEFIDNDKGLHSTLNYLLNKKRINPLDEGEKNIAIFLDKSKISQLEELKNKDENSFDYIRCHPNIKYFFLSGWDNGVTFLDRTKSIKDSAKSALIFNNIDNPLIRRINNLGIAPIVISNKCESGEKEIQEHISPLKMSKNELLTLLDANSQERVSGERNLLVAKDITANYLKENLDVYTPERMSYTLKDIYPQIVNMAKNMGKTEEDIVYIIPDLDKSYGYVNYSYQKINKIPDKYFMTQKDAEADSSYLKNKLAVVLDDCSLTGNSICSVSIGDSLMYALKNTDRVLFYCVNGTQKAKNNFCCEISPQRADLIFYKEDALQDMTKKYSKEDIHILIGEFGYHDGGYAKVFPYMSPDNNSELGSNIALLHNVNYRKDTKKYHQVIYSAIKTPSVKITKIAKMTEDIKNSNPDYFSNPETDISHIDLNKLNKQEMLKKYKEYLSEAEINKWC